MIKLESLVEYLDACLGAADHPDYPAAYNGLQASGPETVSRVVAAVDASMAVVQEAVERKADLLLVHHGLFWGGAAPWTGARFRKLRALVEGGLAVYSCHLPLDGHPEFGNAALVARGLGLTEVSAFGAFQGARIGCKGLLPERMTAEQLTRRMGRVVGRDVHLIPGGPSLVERVGIVTGGGASFLQEAAVAGLDALLTGEGPHHTHADAMEAGIHVLLGGHYATETFGVRALAEHVGERFGLEWAFLDHPSGL
jgi:dinuclear metal center YbgI/SA1388 family protein